MFLLLNKVICVMNKPAFTVIDNSYTKMKICDYLH